MCADRNRKGKKVDYGFSDRQSGLRYTHANGIGRCFHNFVNGCHVITCDQAFLLNWFSRVAKDTVGLPNLLSEFASCRTSDLK